MRRHRVRRNLMELKVHPDELRDRLEELRYSRRALAGKVGCAPATIHRLVNGDIRHINEKYARAIEGVLNLEAGEYFREPLRAAKTSQRSQDSVNRETAA